jgi:RNA polymerase sigma factor (sigma-70 family)
MRPVLRFLHATAATGVTDAELLRRYAATRDEAAFELLVRRHASAVWAACRRILSADAHAAEDAFQAAFLALAKRPGAIRTGCVAGWLYRVAVNAALKLRRSSGFASLPRERGEAFARRTPPPAHAGGSPDPADLTASAETASVIQEELARLAEAYRLPVVLCDLSGLTHTEAAAQLGWPVGTVSGRLVRAREQLRRRLERRGVALTAAVALAAESNNASANLIRAAVSAACGNPSPAVLSLAEGVLSAMRFAKLKLVAAVACVAAGLAGTGAMVALSQDKKPDPFAPTAGAPDKPLPKVEIKEPFTTAFPEIKAYGGKDGECPRFTGKTKIERDATNVLRRLAQERLDALLQSSALHDAAVKAGREGATSLVESASSLQRRRDIVAAASDIYGPGEELIHWYEEWVSLSKGHEELVEVRRQAGNALLEYVLLVRAERLYAESELLKLMAKVKQKGLDR